MCWRAIGLILTLAVAASAPAATALASGFHVEYAFAGGADGQGPDGFLVKSGSELYGVTSGGGAVGCGTIFSFDLTTGAHTVLYSFKGGDDGCTPGPDLIAAGGRFYGTTTSGGEARAGTVFSFNPASGAETVVYRFLGGADGDYPVAALLEVGGLLYGTTFYGGGSSNCDLGCGSVFSVDPATGAETVLHAFQGGTDGSQPSSSLTKVRDRLYGTTDDGGSSNCWLGCGTVFSIDLASGAESIVYAFAGGANGVEPISNLVEAGGLLVGETYSGGEGCSEGCGTIFSVDPKTGLHKIVYAFAGDGDASNPLGGLTVVGDEIYGTASSDGHSGGAVFSVNPATGAEAVLHAFKGKAGGVFPRGVIFSGRALYGDAYEGGVNCGREGCGTLFTLKP